MQHIREPEQRADALYSLGQTLYRFGRYAEAGTVFRQGAALFEDGDRQVRLSFEAAAFGAEYHLPPEQHGPLSAADGTGPGDRAVLAVHALRKCLMSPPASAGADMAIRALRDGALLAELTSRSPVVSLAVLALLHSGRLVEAHEAADAVVADARARGAPMAYAEASLVRALVLLGAGAYHRGRGGCPDGAGPNGMACTRANRGGDVGQLHDRTSRTHRSRERARQG